MLAIVLQLMLLPAGFGKRSVSAISRSILRRKRIQATAVRIFCLTVFLGNIICNVIVD